MSAGYGIVEVQDMEIKNKQLIAAIELYKSAENDTVRDQAIGIMESMGAAGDVSACLILGVNYDPTKEKGFTRRDEEKALRWYTEAAELGEPKGANEAAILYYRSGENRDLALAEKYIQMAVDLAPENEVYAKNYDVIMPRPEPEPEPEEEAPVAADDDGDDEDVGGGDAPRAEPDGGEPAPEKTIVTGSMGNLRIFDIVCGVIIAGVAVLFVLWHLEPVYLLGLAALIALVGYYNWRMVRCAVAVTNRRVSGRCSFQRMVDVPVDSISSVGTCAFGGVKVTAPSSRSAFYLVKNAGEVRSAVVRLLVERQERAERPVVICQDSSCSYADELTKLSELVDAGFVTQEEFEELKDEIIHT